MTAKFAGACYYCASELENFKQEVAKLENAELEAVREEFENVLRFGRHSDR